MKFVTAYAKMNLANAVLLKEGFENKRIDGKLSMRYFLEMLMIFYRDMIKGNTRIQNDIYIRCLKKQQEQGVKAQRILEILLTTRDKLLRSVNLMLLLDQMMYQIQNSMQK